jgi:hypothetical protein
MNNPRDKSSQVSGEGTAEPATDDSRPAEQSSEHAADGKRSGRISYDDRGNSVWEWQLQTGVYSRDINTQRLKKLDLNDLSIAETGSHPVPPGLTDIHKESQRQPSGGGFDPYDNSTTGGGNVANDPYNSAGRGALKPDPLRAQSDSKNRPPRKPLDMKKLQEWIELRKRVEQNKREDGDD